MDPDNNEFFGIGLYPDGKLLQGSGPDSDLVNGKELRNFVAEKLYFVCFDFILTWILNISNFLDLD